jgi:hypothetical protein
MNKCEHPIISSTVYHTPHGDLEIKNPTEDVVITQESHLAPLWLVFPDHIFNTQNIIWMNKDPDGICICMSSGKEITIQVKDIEKTWNALQKAFAEGVAKNS